MLKTKVNEILPEGENVYGFEGVSKKLIVDTIADAYLIVSALDEYESNFEAILLERKSSDYYERAAKLLKENFETKKDDFNEFLNIISKIHFRIKETYISIVKEPVRTESQIQKAKEELLTLEEKLAEIKPIYENIVEIKSDTEKFSTELKEKHSEAFKQSEIIKDELNEIEILKSEAEISAGNISTWENNIRDIKKDISANSAIYEDLKTKIDLLKTDATNTSNDLYSLLDVYKHQIDENAKFQTEIQKTIEDANRLGMAGSFKNRKDELNGSLILWGIGTVLSIVLLIVLSTIFLMQIKREDLEIGKVLLRLPIFASCVWLGWFCAKQYGFTSRIMEDYAYKYAVSMAFEGYKNATKDIDPVLQSKLLDMTITNISANPISNYDSLTNHGTPFHEIAENIPKRLSAKKKAAGVEVDVSLSEK
jgi:hypothetical protein